MTHHHFLRFLLLASAVVFALPSFAQLSVSLKVPVYERFLRIKGNNVNLRKGPSTKTARLISGEANRDGEPTLEKICFSDDPLARHLRHVSPRQGENGMILPWVGQTDGWRQAVYEEREFGGSGDRGHLVWVASQFTEPFDFQPGITLTSTLTEEMVGMGNTGQVAHRRTGKFKELMYFISVSSPGEDNPIDIYIPFYSGDSRFVILFCNGLYVSKDNTAPFSYKMVPDEETGESKLRATLTVPADVDFGNMYEIHRAVADALKQCSDADFENYLRKMFVPKAKTSDYFLTSYYQTETDGLYQYEYYYKDAPKGRLLDTVVDFTKNTNADDLETLRLYYDSEE